MLKRTHRRINVTFIIVFVLLLVLGVRIFMINYTHGEEYSQAVLNHQTYTSTTIPYMRGNITASDGTVLAYSEKVFFLILSLSRPKHFTNASIVLLRYFPSSDVTLFTSSIRLYTFSLYARTVPSLAVR